MLSRLSIVDGLDHSADLDMPAALRASPRLSVSKAAVYSIYISIKNILNSFYYPHNTKTQTDPSKIYYSNTNPDKSK